MRLRDRTPDLSHGEGTIDAYNSNSEDTPPLTDIEREYNQLRDAELLTRGVGYSDIAGIASSEIHDLFSRKKHEVIIAQQIHATGQPDRLAGMAIGQRKRTGDFEARMIVKELVVHPELRRRHVASHLLGRLTQNLDPRLNPTEMTVATNRFRPEEWFLEGLESAGFHHTDENGSPSVWLPGPRWSGQGDLNNKNFVKNIDAHMPDGWNGHAAVFPSSKHEESQLRVYRDGLLRGIVRPVKDSGNLDRRAEDFTVSDPGDVVLGTLKAVTANEAMIALLNDALEKAA